MNRKQILMGLGGLVLTPGLNAASPDEAFEKHDNPPGQHPNVVIFLTDDQGAIDINSFGAADLYTPNLDRLCETGVKFTRFYANSSVSSPSRASILTGRYPQRAGVPMIVPANPEKPGLPGSEHTLADILKDNGYSTALIGKWHLGMNPGAHPNDNGFDYFFGHLGGCIDNYSHYFYWSGPNQHDLYRNGEEVWREGENFSDLMVEQSLAFIENNKDKPFFLFFSSNYPHYPLQGDAKWREYYKNTPHPRDKYAAMVSTIDEKIGMVLNKLEREGLRENTIIVFMSDNGFSREERTFFGGGSAGELRGEKFSVYEGGIRVPAILSYPGRIPQGEECVEIGLGFDWLPTVIELCGLESPEHPIDGKSLLPAVDHVKPASRVIHWEVNKNWAVYKNGYKLVGETNGKRDSIELYHLVSDMSETRDIAKNLPDIVADMIVERGLWLSEMKLDTTSKHESDPR